MSIKDIFIREVASASDGNTIHEAAMFMRKAHVGSLVVVNDQHAPIGILTDRDIVLSVVAAGLEPKAVKVTDVMTRDPLVVHEDADLWGTIQIMRAHGVRRLPVVNSQHQLVGIIAADDMLELLAKQGYTLIELIGQEQMKELNRLN
jgi:CBS domain-containing protein